MRTCEANKLQQLAERVRENRTHVRDRFQQLLDYLTEILGGLNFDVLLWETKDPVTGYPTEFRLTGKMYEIEPKPKIYFYKRIFFSDGSIGNFEKEIIPSEMSISQIRKYTEAIVNVLPDIQKQLEELNKTCEELNKLIEKCLS